MRPSKLTKEIEDRLVIAVRAGNYRAESAAYAGIGSSTFLDWMKKGRDLREKGKTGPYVRLLERVEHAELEGEAHMVLLWRTHMKTDYRAIRDFLERRHPDKWGRKETVVHQGGSAPAPSGEQLADPFCKRLAENPDALVKYNELLAALSGGQAPTG